MKNEDLIPNQLEENVEEHTAELVKINEQLQQEITERKRVEATLKESKERYDMATQAAKVGVWDWNLQTGEFYLDPNVKALLGYADKEIPNDSEVWTTYVHPDDKQSVMEAAQAHIEGRTPEYVYEHRMLHKDGSLRWFLVRGTAIRDAQGNAIRLLGTDTDITERKLAEKELQQYRDRLEEIIKERTAELTAVNKQLKQEITERGWIKKALLESEEQYRGLFENAIIGIYKTTPDGKIVAANPTLVKVLGYSSFEELAERNLEKEKFTSYGRNLFKEMLERDEEIIGLESKWLRKDGSALHVVENTKAIRDKNGKIIYYEGTVEDITRQKKLEESIQELNEELVHVSRVTTMGELVASLAHEINQPLTAILSNVQVAQRFLDGNTPNLDELNEIMSDIVKDNKRAVEVITRLRALLKKDVTNFRPLDINDAIKEIISFVQSDMIRKNVAIVTELVADIPLILGDRIQLQQVLLNLIMNGAEAMADTEPALRKLIIRTEKQDEQNVKVTVQDLGTGFNVDTIEHMFDPFHTTKPKGMGIGLWISRSIIEAHKGLLQAENNSDKGAMFWFVIPVEMLEVS